MQMPLDANIPYEWQVGNEANVQVIVVPSWSQTEKTSYAVFMDKKTRELKCECKGFQVRGDCHHVRGLKWFCSHPIFRGKGPSKTQLESFHALTKESLAESQNIVLKAIEIIGPASDRELATVLGWPINREVPRRSEIEDMGLIRCAGEKLDTQTNRSVMVWSVA